ncbi:MAG: endolytic transglycosylase MltG [Gammaproteobacteria bacterium]|nr:endolytic transglycosylase MltG [Gammaproteobacteria bacterium]MBQ0840133.1 endolytic transglycosylase MltG [Gammaproteobacteria bacterium]
MLRRLILVALVLSAAALGLAWQWLQQGMAESLNIPSQGYTLTVPSGGNLNQLAAQLEREGVLSTVWPLKVFARLNDRGRIRAGEYEFVAGVTVLGLLDKLESGAIKYYQITFPEGLTLGEWLALLRARENIRQTPELDALAVTTALGIQTGNHLDNQSDNQSDNPEGWFAPDTYSFAAGDSELSILRRAYQKMQSQLETLWPNRAPDLPYETPYEALIMASIIEKETGAVEERAAIAGVFVRRLQMGMRLQTDPTVIYGLGDDYTGNLRRKHLSSSSPYNTYRINGLPPTPIANPGAAALVAALHPAEGKALYFVARGDGGHYFSDNLAEHQRAVRQYQINRRRKDYRSAPQ